MSCHLLKQADIKAPPLCRLSVHPSVWNVHPPLSVNSPTCLNVTHWCVETGASFWYSSRDLFKHRTSRNYIISGSLQHISSEEDGKTVDYIVSGAGHFSDELKLHQWDIPKGSLKFFWGKWKGLGGFAYFEATSKQLTMNFISGLNQTLYSHTMSPRQWPSSRISWPVVIPILVKILILKEKWNFKLGFI